MRCQQSAVMSITSSKFPSKISVENSEYNLLSALGPKDYIS